MYRNAFLAITASLASLSLPPCAAADILPPVYANGIDDDSPALQWRLDHGMSVHIEDQTLLLKTPVQLRTPGASLSFKNTEVLSGFDDNRVLVNGVLCYGGSAGEADK